jgi:hypothetical protein
MITFAVNIFNVTLRIHIFNQLKNLMFIKLTTIVFCFSEIRNHLY